MVENHNLRKHKSGLVDSSPVVPANAYIVNVMWREKRERLLTCFSKAVGTRRRSSDRLLFIRSRLRFSMTCGGKGEK